MTDSRTVNTKRNLYWGIFTRMTGIIFPFITRTVMIYTLGMSYIGLDSLFSALLNVLSFAELGFGGALVFSMYKPMAENDIITINALLAFYRKCYRIIGTIILILGLLMLPFLNFFVSGNIPDNVNLKALFFIQLFNTVSGYYLFAYKSSIFQAQQRVDISQKVTLILNVLSNIVRVIILLTLKNFYVYLLVGPVITILQNVMVAWFAKKYFPEFYCDGYINKKTKFEIQKKVSGLVFQKIGGIILTSADTIVISVFLGLHILGIYNGYYYVIAALTGFIGVIQTSMIPSLGNSVATENKEKNYNDLRKFHFFIAWILTWWSVCLLCLYQPFIELWQGKNNMLSFDMVVLFSLYFFLHHIGDICYMYKEAAGIWWEGRYYSLVAAGVNLILNIIFVKIIGLSGILLSTIFAVAVIHIPYGGWILFKHYFVSKEKYFIYIKYIMVYFIVAVVIAAITYIICLIFSVHTLWLTLLLRGGICLVLPNILFWLFFRRLSEFQEAWKYFDTVLIRRK